MKIKRNSPKLDSASRPWRSGWMFALAACCAVLTPPALWLVDLPVAAACHDTPAHNGREAVPSWAKQHLPAWSEFMKLFELSEVFAHGLGVALLLVTLLVLDESSRRHLPRVAACAYLAGLTADLIKLGILRLRPRVWTDWIHDGRYPVESVWDTFLRRDQAPDFFASDYHSFPSAHTAVAAGFAAALACRYPRARWWFLALASLAALQRITSLAHHVSDALAGAAVGFFVAGILCQRRILGFLFDRLESPSA